MALTELQIRNAQPREKVYKLYDGSGLVLRVKPNGSKLWEHKYRVYGSTGEVKEKALPLGKWSDVSLKDARRKNMDAQILRQEGKDPALERKKRKLEAQIAAADTFEAAAREWHETNKSKWTPRHAERVWQRLEDFILPGLGWMPIGEILPVQILSEIQKVEKAGKTETAHKLLQDCCRIFRPAALLGKIKYNPARELQGLLKPHVATNLPSIDPSELPQFLQKFSETVMPERDRIAMSLLMLTFLRTGELRKGKKKCLNFNEHLWEVDKEDMKKRRSHVVPLSRQAQILLKRLEEMFPDSEYLFPCLHPQKNPYMCENTINNLIHRMGYKGQMVGHGFRSLASTILNREGFNEDAIEIQLAHAPSNSVRAVYNRYRYVDERRNMMQWWGDYLEKNGLIVS